MAERLWFVAVAAPANWRRVGMTPSKGSAPSPPIRLLYRCYRVWATLLWLTMFVLAPWVFLAAACKLLFAIHRPALLSIVWAMEWPGRHLALFGLGVVCTAFLIELCGWSPRVWHLVPRAGRWRWERWDMTEREIDWFERHGVRTKERRRAEGLR